MHELAYELGFFCAPATTFMVDLASKIAVHLKNRSGKVVYQSAAFSMENFPLELARQAFAMASVSPSTSPTTTTWTVTTQAQVQLVFGSIFEDHHAFCAGASKAIQTKSQPVIRLLATILKGAEISHVQLARGVQRLYINFQYALSDETGELHLPKDNNRIEIAFSEADLHEIRAQVATDAALLGMMGLPLSAKWWRQVGNEEEAQMAEALVQNLSTQPRVVKGKRGGRRRTATTSRRCSRSTRRATGRSCSGRAITRVGRRGASMARRGRRWRPGSRRASCSAQRRGRAWRS